MIKQFLENRKLKRITMVAAMATLGIGLITSLSSYDEWDDELLNEDDGTGSYWASSGSMYVESTMGSGSGSGSGSGDSSSCWATTKVFCSETVTTVNGTSTTGGPGGSFTGSKTYGPSGTTTGVAATIDLGSLFKKKTRNNSEQRVTKYRADCESGGSAGCQPTNCEGASVGTYQQCNH